MRQQLAEEVSVPGSIALPFGTFERVLSDGINYSTAGNISSLIGALENAKEGQVPKELKELRQEVLKLQPPDALIAEVRLGSAKTEAQDARPYL